MYVRVSAMTVRVCVFGMIVRACVSHEHTGVCLARPYVRELLQSMFAYVEGAAQKTSGIKVHDVRLGGMCMSVLTCDTIACHACLQAHTWRV